jgi:hypothetical protein
VLKKRESEMGNSSSSVPRSDVVRCLYKETEIEELYLKHISSTAGPVQIPDSFNNHGLASPNKMIDLLASQVGEALGASFFDKRLQLLGQSGVWTDQFVY